MAAGEDAVFIIGVGARTPLGFDLAASAAAFRAGISAIQNHPYMIDRFGEPMKVTRDAGFDIVLSSQQRAIELGFAAALQALRPLGRSGGTISLIVGAGEQRPGQGAGHAEAIYGALRDRLEGQIAIRNGGVHPGGHSASIIGMLHARDAIRSGRAEICLVGGIDSYLEPETLEWLDEREQLHSEGNIYGFCPGEAAGFCLMTSLKTARQIGCTPLLEVVTVAAAIEANKIMTRSVVLGEGLGAAFQSAFEQAPAAVGLVDRILCDMNGERYRGNEYGFAILRNKNRFRDAADFETPADCWGDVGAASGVLNVGLAVEAEARGYAKGPLSMVWGSSENGQRAAALLRAPRKAA